MTGKLNKILYIEDEPDIQAVAKIALEAVGGFTLKICSSGAEAIASAEAFGPDLILLDVMMPVMDGPATLLKLREIPSLKKVPAIFMTAKVQKEEVNRFISIGAVDVIPKPFDPMTLSEKITTIWERSSV